MFIINELNFLKKNFYLIFTIIFIFSIFNYYVLKYNIRLKKPKRKVVKRMVIESFNKINNDVLLDKLKDVNCMSKNIPKMCKQLETLRGKKSKYSCNTSHCCVWVKNKNNSGCVPGNKDGPLYLTDNNGLKYSNYYYKNKMYKI